MVWQHQPSTAAVIRAVEPFPWPCQGNPVELLSPPHPAAGAPATSLQPLLQLPRHPPFQVLGIQVCLLCLQESGKFTYRLFFHSLVPVCPLDHSCYWKCVPGCWHCSFHPVLIVFSIRPILQHHILLSSPFFDYISLLMAVSSSFLSTNIRYFKVKSPWYYY